MYYFAGGLTIVWAVAIYFILPPDPIRVKGFDERERYVMVARLRSNNAGVRNKHFKAEQALELMLDLKFWTLTSIAILSMFANVSAVGCYATGRIQPYSDRHRAQYRRLFQSSSMDLASAP